MTRTAALVLLVALAGCGGGQQRAVHHGLSFSQPSGRPCHPRNPPALGECVAQHFGFHRRQQLGRPLAAGTACQDWSQWQGSRPSTAGLSCVIIQANYGLHVEPTVWSQVADARQHGVACGLYSFMEGASGSAEARLAVGIYRRTPCTLGVSADAEIGSAYRHACAYTAEAARLGVLALLYTAPGLWPGGRCTGYLWTAEWGVSAPYAFGGYSGSSVKLWQWCGTCGIDLDRDRGLIALGHPESPSERHARKVRELHAAERALGSYKPKRGVRGRVAVLHRSLGRYGCTRRRHHHERLGPRCRRWFGEGDSLHRTGKRLHARIYELRREGIR